ncbi:MAG: hypothetical protein HFF17_08520 [Oscillospiraceae bacterium]|nr:hypothetical protein [Oscillospiraceae bacterium]
MTFQEAWDKAQAFHGCACPALAIGTRATAYILEQFELCGNGPYPVVCTAESFSCAIDAVQSLLGCTIGNGRLRVRSKGRMAFRFCDTRTDRSIYLALRPWLRARPGLTEKLLEMPLERLFLVARGDEAPEPSPNCILSSACPIRAPHPVLRVPDPPCDDLYIRDFDRDW